MQKHDIYVGIDPDREKSGVAVLQRGTRAIDLETLSFPALLAMLKGMKRIAMTEHKRLLVVVEAGWMVEKSNYHPYQGRRAEKIAHDVGANHETGKKIVEMCKFWGIEVLEQHPLKKIWRSKDGKITAEEFRQVTGYDKKCNQDARDAGLIAWYAADLPMRVVYPTS